MTFAEAAIEVLYRAGRPLHYKKITEAAIQEELLSHIGRTPETTMSERLDQEVKKKNDSPVVNVRPGVFKLDEDYAKKLESEGHKRLPLGQKKKKKKETKTNGAQAKSADRDSSSRDSRSDDSSKNGKSRRRRRRSRGSSKRQSKSNGRRSGRGSNRKSNRRSKSKSNRRSKSKSGRRSSRKSKNDRSRKRSSRKDNRKRRSSKKRSAQRKPSQKGRHLKEGPVRLNDIASAAHTVLEDNNNKPMKVADLAKEIFDRKLVKFHTHDATATVQAAMAGDNQIRKKKGNRPLFIQYDRNRWGLTEWGLSQVSIEREQSILSLSEEIRQDAVETLGEALVDIKPEAVEHLALTLLERLGYRDIKVSKRSSEGDVYFTSDWRQGLADVRVCIQVMGDADENLSADVVTELRGTLHHYSASEGVIIHLGDIDDDAVEESREEKLAPITLIDRDTFVELLITHGIGVRTYQAPITMVDTAFIDALATV